VGSNQDRELFERFILEMRHLPAVLAPEGLAEDVLRRVRSRESPRWAFFRQWRPVFAMAAMLLAAVTGFWGANSLSPRPMVGGRPVEFQFAHEKASTVHLVGDFNKWNKKSLKMKKSPDGKWQIKVRLKPGSYQYLFLVDGTAWSPDPNSAEAVEDGFGGYNSSIDL
jgi:hypothetical protein